MDFMNNKTIISIIIIIVLSLGAYVYFDSRTQESSDPELNIKVNVKSDVANDDETMIEKVMIEKVMIEEKSCKWRD